MKNPNRMKFTILILLLFSIGFANAQILKAEIIATGLTCSMCSNAINKQLKKIADVDSVGTDLNTNTFIVYLKKDRNIQPRILKESVENPGFFVGAMVLTVQFNDLNSESKPTVKIDNSTLVFIDDQPEFSNEITKVKIFDKGYVTQKEYKKLLKSLSKHPTYAIENEDDYHLKIIQK
jgi:copper chaperone CopZ